jgi:uncharacterized protein YecE (DUF72 family)
MRMLAGTTGFSYKEWVGPFYPEKTPASAWLRFYGEQFPTVEINNTFYRMPGQPLLERWAQEVPEAFVFTLKASRFITHIKRLKDVQTSVAEFIRRASFLGGKLGMLLFQLPPTLRKDLPRLREFLDAVPSGYRFAVEFRHASWQEDEVYEALRARGAALCVTETDEEGSTPFVCTAEDAYLRLRRTRYSEDDLRAWADHLAAQPLTRAWVYFKHEDEALATRFARDLSEVWRRKHGRANGTA